MKTQLLTGYGAKQYLCEPCILLCSVRKCNLRPHILVHHFSVVMAQLLTVCKSNLCLKSDEKVSSLASTKETYFHFRIHFWSVWNTVVTGKEELCIAASERREIVNVHIFDVTVENTRWVEDAYNAVVMRNHKRKKHFTSLHR